MILTCIFCFTIQLCFIGKFMWDFRCLQWVSAESRHLIPKTSSWKQFLRCLTQPRKFYQVTLKMLPRQGTTGKVAAMALLILNHGQSSSHTGLWAEALICDVGNLCSSTFFSCSFKLLPPTFLWFERIQFSVSEIFNTRSIELETESK